MALSGIVISRHVFVDTGIESGQGSARIVHMLGAYWGFIIMSIHAGMHGKFLTGMIKKRRKRGKNSRIAKITGNTAAAVIALYGAFVFIRSEIPLYMFLRTQFVYFDQAKPFLHYFTDYLSMMWLWIFTGYYASEKMTRLRSINHV